MMQTKDGAKDDGNSEYLPASTGNSFFTDQAFHAALLDNCQNFYGSDISRYLCDVMVEREMEKRRMREEISMLRLLRRRELEEVVMGEIMMERQMSMRCGGGGVLEGGVDGRSSLAGRMDDGGFGGFALQRQQRGGNAVAVKPIIDLRKGQVVSMVKPSRSSSTAAGIKRKFEAPITEVDDDNTPSVNLSKKSRKELNCSLCQVAVSCERSLKSHLNGKKHKAKEKALLRNSETVSYNDGNPKPLAEETENSNGLVVVPTDSLSRALENSNDLQNKDSVKKTNGSADVREKQTSTELNMDFKCWCQMCQVGTTSEELMTDHRMGKHHLTLLQEKGGCLITINTMPK